jgi:hypothetical protein
MYDLFWLEAQSVAEAIPKHYSKKVLKEYIARKYPAAVITGW